MRTALDRTQRMVGLVLGLYRELALSALTLLPGRDPQRRA